MFHCLGPGSACEVQGTAEYHIVVSYDTVEGVSEVWLPVSRVILSDVVGWIPLSPPPPPPPPPGLAVRD